MLHHALPVLTLFNLVISHYAPFQPQQAVHCNLVCCIAFLWASFTTIRNLKAKTHTVQWANNNYWLIESSQERPVIYLPPLPQVTRWVSSNQLVVWGRIRPYSPAEQADPPSCWCNLPPHYILSQSFKPFQVSILLSPWLKTTSTTVSLLSVFIFHILSGFSVCIFFTAQQHFFSVNLSQGHTAVLHKPKPWSTNSWTCGLLHRVTSLYFCLLVYWTKCIAGASWRLFVPHRNQHSLHTNQDMIIQGRKQANQKPKQGKKGTAQQI